MNLERSDWVGGGVSDVMDGWMVAEKTEAVLLPQSSEDLSPKVDAVEKPTGTVGRCFHPSSPRNLFIHGDSCVEMLEQDSKYPLFSGINHTLHFPIMSSSISIQQHPECYRHANIYFSLSYFEMLQYGKERDNSI